VRLLALASLAAALSSPCFAQQKKPAAPRDPNQIDSMLLMDVRDRLIQRGHPTNLGAGGIQSCLNDSTSFTPGELAVCQQASMMREKPNKSGVISGVIRYALGDLTVSVADGDDHLVFMIGPDDRVSQIIKIDSHGVPQSSILSPKVRETLINALRRATTLPLIEA
jgi:hypothetical protein